MNQNECSEIKKKSPTTSKSSVFSLTSSPPTQKRQSVGFERMCKKNATSKYVDDENDENDVESVSSNNSYDYYPSEDEEENAILKKSSVKRLIQSLSSQSIAETTKNSKK
jgi:hypothetical protein